jgi:hypothetical protein
MVAIALASRVLIRRFARTDIVVRVVPLAQLGVLGEPQPRFCHVEEDQLGGGFIDQRSELHAIGRIGPVRTTLAFVHEEPWPPDNVTRRRINAKGEGSFPIL